MTHHQKALQTRSPSRDIPHPTSHIPHPTSHIPQPTTHNPQPTTHISHPNTPPSILFASMGFVQRSVMCGELRLADVGTQVVLNGWAHKVRDLGGLFFVDMRDRSGLIQLNFDPARFPNLNEIKSETCLAVSGEVVARQEAVRNPKMETGDVEVLVSG